MAIKKPAEFNRLGEKRKKELGDRTFSVAKALIFGGIAFIAFAILCLVAKQWGAAIAFLVGAAATYYPIRYIYRFPATAYRLENDGITVFEMDDKTTFVPYSNIKRVTTFNPEITSTLFFSSRRSIFITLKAEENEENPKVIRILFPHDVEAVYFLILKTKLEFDGIPVDR